MKWREAPNLAPNLKSSKMHRVLRCTAPLIVNPSRLASAAITACSMNHAFRDSRVKRVPPFFIYSRGERGPPFPSIFEESSSARVSKWNVLGTKGDLRSSELAPWPEGASMQESRNLLEFAISVTSNSHSYMSTFLSDDLSHVMWCREAVEGVNEFHPFSFQPSTPPHSSSLSPSSSDSLTTQRTRPISLDWGGAQNRRPDYSSTRDWVNRS